MNRLNRLLVWGILASLIAAGLAVPAATTTTQAQSSVAQLPRPGAVSDEGINQLPPMVPGVVLVGLQPGVAVSMGHLGVRASNAALDAAFADLGVQGIEPVFPNARRSLAATATDDEIDLSRIYRLHLAPDADVLRVVRELNANPAVAYAEPDYLAHVVATPNDPLYGGQWGLPQINAPAAWDVVTGATDVVIAVVDAGMDTSHPDLAGQLWTNPGEIAGNSVDDDNNGCVDDVHGWNIVDDDGNLSDNTGHGTQVAGVIAAATDNGQGVAGVCWNCRLMVVKVTQSGGIANYSDIAAGVAYAAQKGAEVVNLSLGGYSDSATLRAAVAAASQTAVVVGGAGNDDRSDAFYPAAYDDYVLAVAGTTSGDTKVGTSNYGTWVDVSAPGEAITTTFDGGVYGSTSGTSMAAPFAAGLAGLLRSQHPAWSANMARAQIVQTADGIDGLNPGYAGKLGSGRIDADQAVSTAAQPLLSYQSHAVDGEPNGRPEPGSTVDLDLTLTNEWADATNVQTTLNTGDPYVTLVNGAASYGSIAAYDSGTNATSFRFSVAGGAPYAHDIPFMLNVTADGGYAVNIPLTIPTSLGITYVHGTLTTQTWTNDRIYIVDNDAGVTAGHVLTIEAGTVVRFDGDYSLSVAGTLIADGTEGQPIRFMSNQASPTAGDWDQIKFLDSSVDATLDSEGNYTGGSILRYAIIEYGQGVNLNNAAPYIAYNNFDQTSGSGISGSGSAGLVMAGNTLTNTGINLSLSGVITGNSVSGASGTGISAGGSPTVTANRVVDCSQGMVVNGGFVSGNLLANNDGYGLRINGGAPTVVSNTVVFNGGAGVYIASGTPVLHHNNLVASPGQYALHNAMASAVDATANWWGTTSDSAIQAAIYDGNDEFGLGMVNYSGYLSGSEPDAPAYLHNLTLTPASPVGIETVTFDLAFSRPMDHSADSVVTFFTNQRGMQIGGYSFPELPGPTSVQFIVIDTDGVKWFATDGGAASFDGTTWTAYTLFNSGLPDNNVVSVAVGGNNDDVWFGTNGGVARFDGMTWTVYDTSSSGLPNDTVCAIAIDSAGVKWFGTDGGGVARFDDATWTVYDTSSSGLPNDRVCAIAIDSAGAKWFGTHGGVARFDDTSWTVYSASNSDLPSDYVIAIAIDSSGAKWFGTNGGAARFDDTTWTVYSASNSDLPSDCVIAIAIDSSGAKWFKSFSSILLGQAVSRFDGTTWVVYDTDNLSCLPPEVAIGHGIAVDGDGSVWIGTAFGVCVLGYGFDYHVVDNTQWLDAAHWRATYDVTSLVPRGAYTVSVSGARGTDGMEIPTDTRFGFSVDYAGEITDRTAPPPPAVIAGGVQGDASTVEAFWWASDPDSSITGYRYAIGSAAGATDIVNWTSTSSNSITRSGLGLVEGRQYWLAVQARNVGGLWSASGYSAFVAGQPYPRVFLPLVFRNG
jgi:subtilisin family serine protease